MPTIRLNRNLNGLDLLLPEISCFGPMSSGESPACWHVGTHEPASAPCRLSKTHVVALCQTEHPCSLLSGTVSLCLNRMHTLPLKDRCRHGYAACMALQAAGIAFGAVVHAGKASQHRLEAL